MTPWIVPDSRGQGQTGCQAKAPYTPALTQLRATVSHVPGYSPDRTRLALYARDGYTDRFRRAATAQGVILRTVDDLFEDA